MEVGIVEAGFGERKAARSLVTFQPEAHLIFPEEHAEPATNVVFVQTERKEAMS